MFYDALHHQDMQPYNDLLYEQQCINCLAAAALAEESVARLRVGMRLCQHYVAEAGESFLIL